jgi:esterase FrsA
VSQNQSTAARKKMAVVERDRLKAVSVQSPPTDLFFTRKFLTESLLGNREHLFDQVPALMAILDNVNTVDDIAAIFEKMSLVNQGILGKPTTPMLIIAGVKDTQVPISDIYELMNAGDVPKEAWINPSGGHLGRQVKVWPDPIIFRKVLLPWLSHNLDVPQFPEAERKSSD